MNDQLDVLNESIIQSRAIIMAVNGDQRSESPHSGEYVADALWAAEEILDKALVALNEILDTRALARMSAVSNVKIDA